MSLFGIIRRNRDGAATVEFGLLGPVMITVMLGVLQIGTAMWSYNSLRSIASETARYAVVNYQASNKLSTSAISSYASGVATASPYGLTASSLTVVVSSSPTSRIAGTTEMSLTLSYQVPTLLSIVGMGNIPISYTRPIFLLSS